MRKSLRVLIVEDSTPDTQLLLRELRKGKYEPSFEQVDTLEAMSQALDRATWDIVLADYVMPHFSGLAALELLKARGADLPIIIVSGKIGEDVAVEAMKAGAHDYVVKDNLARLVPAIERGLREAETRRGRQEAEEKLRQERERMVAERAARAEAEAARQRISNILESITDAFFALDHDWRLTFVNKEAERLLQRRRQDLIGKNVRDEFPEAVGLKFYRQFHHAAAEQVSVSLEEFYPPLEKWLEVHAYPSRDGLSVYFRDISERKRAELECNRLLDQLRDANQRLTLASVEAQAQAKKAEQRAAELDATFASIADGVIITDLESRIVRVNPAAERILGLTKDELDLPLEERKLVVRAERVDGRPFSIESMPTWRALRYGDTNVGVMMVIHHARTGQAVWVSNSSAPILGLNGEVTGAVTVFSDITALHDLQKQRESFIHTVSHDLRNPLQIIQGQAQVLQRTFNNLGQNGFESRSAEAIITSAKRMSAMIQDLVDSARFEGGQLSLDREPVDLAAFISNLLARAAGVIDVARVDVRVIGDPPWASADPNRLERILLNLLTNALKFSSSETQVQITVELTDDEVTVAVSDQGPGIPEQDLPHIFDRYFRGSGSTRAEGVGLGLYISKMLVEAHGGRIWVESKAGNGTSLYFTLPAA